MRKIPVAKIVLSDRPYASEAFEALLTQYIKGKANGIRNKRENSLWHKLLVTLGFAHERIVDVFGTKVENPRVRMYDMLEEKELTEKTLDEFEKWRSVQPKKKGKKAVDYFEEFLEFKGGMPLNVQ